MTDQSISMGNEKTAVVIYNPFAGRGHACHYAKYAGNLLSTMGWQVKGLFPTRYAGHAETVLAPKWSPLVNLLVVIGGDGTLREVCAGMDREHSRASVAFIPKGNANVIARELGIPLKVKKAVELIANGTPMAVDAGILKLATGEQRLFLAMAEVGFGAKVVEKVDKYRHGWMKTFYKIFGNGLYAIAGLMALFSENQEPFSLQVDTQPADTNLRHCVISNTRTYARGWSITPRAEFGDGVFDILARDDVSIFSTMILLYSAFHRKGVSPVWAHYNRARKIHVSSKNLLSIQIDGDTIAPSTDFTVEVSHHHFNILVPPDKGQHP